MAFLTYNIWGAGMPNMKGEDDYEGGVGDDRLYWILDIIEAYGSDVVGLQEVWWSAEDTVYANGRSTADSVGTLLGMYHWVDRPEGAQIYSDAGILSKYPFLQKEYLDSPTFNRHIRKATIVDDYGEPWIVYNMHLNSFSYDEAVEALRTEEREYVRDHVEASDDTLAIVMGDMNCSADSMQMYLPGWTLIASVIYAPWSPNHDLDQVWISGDLDKVWKLGTVDLSTHPKYEDWIARGSDHHPAVGIVYLPVK